MSIAPTSICKSKFLEYCACVALVLHSFTTASHAVDDVAGELVVLTNSTAAPNGAWSWFQDERAIIDDSDTNNTKLLVSSISYADSGDERGDINLLWYNVDQKTQGHFQLHDTFGSPNDHNTAAIYQRTDGRYLAVYSGHNADSLTRYRVSTRAADPAGWEPEQTIENGAATTYSNIHYLSGDNNGDGRLYNFARATNFDPTIAISNDEGSTWVSDGYKLVTRAGSNIANRPYARYFSGGDRIHVTVTETHPRNNLNNSVYHGYVQDGRLYNSYGAQMDANLFDGNAISPGQLTPIFLGGTAINGTTMTRSWTTDVALNQTGHPVTVFTARANDSDEDHRLFYAAFNGTDWLVEEIAKMGAGLYAGEDDYTGLAAIDPDDTKAVFVSTNIDPRNQQPLEHYEIFRGIRSGHANWEWDPITFHSTVDNLRPLVPKWNVDETALIWMRGNYTTYTNWDTEVVALTNIGSLIDRPSPADLSRDENVTTHDFSLFMANLFTDVSNLTPDEAELLGDFDRDLDVDFEDFKFFRREFDLFNGAGALRLSQLVIPEPASTLLSATGLVLASATRTISRTM